MKIIRLITLVVALAPAGHACYYSPYDFNAKDNSQTEPDKVIHDHYTNDKTRERNFFSNEYSTKGPELAANTTDIAVQEQYAYVLFRTGRMAEAERIWLSILKTEPERYSTLCTYATALQVQQKFDQAETVLKKAVGIKPGFRSGAEELHLKYIAWVREQRKDPRYGEKNFFVPELAAVWAARKPPPPTLEDAEFPQVEPDGMAELLRQFPMFADGWHCLGIMLEQDGQIASARKAYERAVKTGATRKGEIQQYLIPLLAYEKKQDPVKKTARSMKWLSIIGIGLFVVYKILRITSSVQKDIHEARQAREQKQARTKKPDTEKGP